MTSEPERTPDGRYLVIKGRRWRASDPSIPEALRSELVDALMTGRRLVRTEGDAARVMVHDAKVALGERGEAWWEPTDEGRRERLAATIRTLLRERGEDSTICPSDAARVVGGQDWRDHMVTAREVAAGLHDDDEVRILQRGESVDPGPGGSDLRGPIRIAAGEALEFRPD